MSQREEGTAPKARDSWTRDRHGSSRALIQTILLKPPATVHQNGKTSSICHFPETALRRSWDVRAILVALAAAMALSAQQPSAEALIEAGHWKRARALVEQRLREKPDDPNALFLSSQIRNAFGDHSSPLPLAEKAVSLDGGVARYHRQVAEVLGVEAQHAGMFQQVGLAHRFRKEIDIALNLDPRDTQALRDLMEFYLLAPGILGGDTDKAGRMAERIAAVDATEGFLAKARMAEFRKNAFQRETMLRHAAEARPLSYKADMALAEFDLDPAHRNDTDAEAFARGALEADPGRSGAYSVLAAVYARQANWRALEEILSAAARAVADDPIPYYRAAAQLLADSREPERAERYLRIYLLQEPEGNEPSAADARAKLELAMRLRGPAHQRGLP